MIRRDRLGGGGGRSVSGGGVGVGAAASMDDGEEVLDLFSRSRRSLPLADVNPRDGAVRSEGIAGRLGRTGLDDLFSAEIGKNDYDWLLTPPGTPHFKDSTEHHIPSATPRSGSNIRAVSNTKASRFSTVQPENGRSTRPTRSVSVTRPAISSTHSSSYLSNNNRTSVLNTSTSSISSRPSTPGNRSTIGSSVRTSVPSSRTVPARSTTPSRTQSQPISRGDKTRPTHSSRPSTPTGRPQTPASANSTSNTLAGRSNSRPSTPTRRTTAPPSAPAVTARSSSVGRISAANGRNPGPGSRPSSPSPRPRVPSQPIGLPDFSLDVPPNLRTKLPERPVSAGRMRPGLALTARTNSNTEAAAPPPSSTRRSSSPIVTRGRFPENPPKSRVHGNGHEASRTEMQKPVVSDAMTRKPVKPASATESTGFGRNISKKSLDMALRHMDIRQSMGSVRGASLFPRTIRSAAIGAAAATKGHPARMSDPKVHSIAVRVATHDENSNTGDLNDAVSENGFGSIKSPERESMVTVTEPDIYKSSRYDAILLKEDSKNMSWLHSVEDRSDQSPEFDHRFEPLPEPFDPL